MQRATLPEGVWARRHAYISQTEILFTYQKQMALYDQYEVWLDPRTFFTYSSDLAG